MHCFVVFNIDFEQVNLCRAFTSRKVLPLVVNVAYKNHIVVKRQLLVTVYYLPDELNDSLFA